MRLRHAGVAHLADDGAGGVKGGQQRGRLLSFPIPNVEPHMGHR